VEIPMDLKLPMDDEKAKLLPKIIVSTVHEVFGSK
jgi:hypothetical protein